MLWTEWLLTINPLSNPATTKLPNRRERRRHFQNPSGSEPKQTATFTQGHSALIARGDDRDASQKKGSINIPPSASSAAVSNRRYQPRSGNKHLRLPIDK